MGLGWNSHGKPRAPGVGVCRISDKSDHRQVFEASMDSKRKNKLGVYPLFQYGIYMAWFLLKVTF